ncbi:unnamed protein product [Victoria cruziana]
MSSVKSGGGGGEEVGKGGVGWWQNATAGAIAGFATVVSLHPLDVVRTRFQVNDGRQSVLPLYKNTAHAMYTIARTERLRGLYAGLGPAILGSTLSWGLYFFFYSRAKERYLKRREDRLGPGLHLVSSAEAGVLVCLLTNPVWLVKTRLQLQTPLQQTRQYSGFSDAVRSILKEEGWHALYRGIGPSLLLVSHGALQFMFYEECRKALIRVRSNEEDARNHGDVLSSGDYAILGAFSKLAAMMITYPYQVMRSRMQQRPGCDGSHKYSSVLHLVKETLRFEGIRGFYRGITPSLAKNIPAASITFVVYEKVYSLLTSTRDVN